MAEWRVLARTADVLAEHQEEANDRGVIECQCGGFRTLSPWLMAGHQADALAAAGLLRR
jgi:hypothetical protein